MFCFRIGNEKCWEEGNKIWKGGKEEGIVEKVCSLELRWWVDLFCLFFLGINLFISKNRDDYVFLIRVLWELILDIVLEIFFLFYEI